MKKTIVTALVGAIMLVAPAMANARPVTDNFQANPERSDCRVTQVRNNGYIIEVKKIVGDKVIWDDTRVKVLPDPEEVTFRLKKDLGTTRIVVCEYPRK